MSQKWCSKRCITRILLLLPILIRTHLKRTRCTKIYATEEHFFRQGIQVVS